MLKKELAIFGAGVLGQEAALYYRSHEYEIKCFIDNSKEKQGSFIGNIPIYSFEYYLKKSGCDIVIPGGHRKEIEAQLLRAGKENFFFYDDQLLLEKERIVSYCGGGMEDVILYHLLKENDKIFYIDVGSNDPTVSSVTKLLYDRLNASGINIEPQPALMAQTKRERLRDVNLCVGCGKEMGGGSFTCKGNCLRCVMKIGFLKK